MIKIKVSFENERELLSLINRLKPNVLKYKVSKNEKGKYKKAYIELRGGQ